MKLVNRQHTPNYRRIRLQALILLMIICVLSSYTVARAADTGFLSPSATGIPNNDWSNPGEAFSSDGLYAIETINGQMQDWSVFNFGVPVGATIDGIEVTVEAQDNYCNSAEGAIVELSWNGGTNYTTSSYNFTGGCATDTTTTLGGAADLWGRTWTSSDFSNANFRIRFSKQGFNGDPAWVDHIQVKVYYTAGVTYTLSGRVFADAVVGATGQPFNGGEGDTGITNVRVELFDNAGTFQTFTTTDGSGNYNFNSLSASSSYTVRVVATGIDAGVGALGEQTFESDGISNYGGFGTAMGGQNAALADTATLATLTGAEHRVGVAVGTADVIGVDFGFSYDLIVNTNDSGQGSLRQFITNANLIAGIDTSIFNIPTTDTNYNGTGNGEFTIQPTSALPIITSPIVLDGTTQTANIGDTNGNGPEVELNGSGAGAGVNGLNIDAGNSTVRGLVINRFTAAGIYITNNGGNLIAGNYIGLDVTGTAPLFGNGADGVDILSSSNTVGGTNAADRNIISNNGDDGVNIDLVTTGNIIEGNYIGTDRTGSIDLGNSSDGVLLERGTSGNWVGGTNPLARNIISGNGGSGVNILDAGTDANLIQGNYIGTDVSGTLAIGNAGYGVLIEDGPADNSIGGIAGLAGNLIANNGLDGVALSATAMTGNAILRNSIFQNGQQGIDLNADGDTANDGDDLDSGPNDLLNYPVISSAVDASGTVWIDFDADLQAGSYRIEFFRNPSGTDAPGNGEGETFVGSVDIDHTGSGLESFSHTFPGSAGDDITTTATRCTDGATCLAFGSTSEFSAAYTVLPGYELMGTVFEDVNYGGGNGRSYITANTSAVNSGHLTSGKNN